MKKEAELEEPRNLQGFHNLFFKDDAATLWKKEENERLRQASVITMANVATTREQDTILDQLKEPSLEEME